MMGRMGPKGSSCTTREDSGGLSIMVGVMKYPFFPPSLSGKVPPIAGFQPCLGISENRSLTFSYCMLFCNGPKKMSASSPLPVFRVRV